MKIGEGGFGTVYRALLPGGQVVAIKRAKKAGEQGRSRVLILSIIESNHQRKPAIVFLHSTHKCKEWLRPLLEAYASRGYIAAAIDSRYHREHPSSMTTYRDALVSSWKQGDTMPFIFDMVWDLIKLADYLTQREDIDPSKIGITGMHAWFAAAVDTRYAVALPIIGVHFLVSETRIDLGKSAIDKEVVEQDPTKRPKSIVDVRCGIGGSSRYLARKYEAQCQGITLSPIQAQMAEGLAASQGLANKVSFEVADALNQPFHDAQFPVSILSFQDLLINLKISSLQCM
ncbi:hypothetical protein CsSME_00031282 [Camellia sinensis var. sinensis]